MNELVFEQKESELTKMLKHVSTPVSIILGGLVGLSTTFIPYRLYDFWIYEVFHLHFVLLSLTAFVLSFIMMVKMEQTLNTSINEDFTRLGMGAMLSFSSVFSGTIVGIIVGIAIDPKSHNLFPIEIIMNLIYIVPAVLGAVLAGMINWLIGRLK